MRLVLMVVMLSGCMGAPDDGPTTTVCDPEVAGCHAALVVAEANCTYKLACDDEFTASLQECIDWTMTAICRDFDCAATTYARTNDVEACAADYSATGCHEIITACGL